MNPSNFCVMRNCCVRDLIHSLDVLVVRLKKMGPWTPCWMEGLSPRGGALMRPAQSLAFCPIKFSDLNKTILVTSFTITADRTLIPDITGQKKRYRILLASEFQYGP